LNLSRRPELFDTMPDEYKKWAADKKPEAEKLLAEWKKKITIISSRERAETKARIRYVKIRASLCTFRRGGVLGHFISRSIERLIRRMRSLFRRSRAWRDSAGSWFSAITSSLRPGLRTTICRARRRRNVAIGVDRRCAHCPGLGPADFLPLDVSRQRAIPLSEMK